MKTQLVTLAAALAVALFTAGSAQAMHARDDGPVAVTPVTLFTPDARPEWLGPMPGRLPDATAPSATVTAGNAFDWSTAAAGAAAGVAIILLAGIAFLATKHHDGSHRGALHA